jgi:hypothetical protein
MKARATALLAALLLAVMGQVSALEVSAGRLKLVLHQGIGRFSLYADGIPLFMDRDPRTSGLALMVDNKVYKLGETSEFRATAESLPEGARFVFKSRRLTVTESFSFTSASSLLIAVSFDNISQSDLSVGLRLFLDTYLSEETDPHFQTDLQPINTELAVARGSLPAYWQSASFSARKPAGLRCPLTAPEVTEPDRVVFANWKRMSETKWSYETSPARSFSDIPYSINDSAVLQYYNPIPISPGGSRTVNIAFQAAQPEGKGFKFEAPQPQPAQQPAQKPTQEPAQEAEQKPAPEPAAQQPASEGPQAGSEILQITGDIRVINGLLQKLEEKMSSGSAISEEEFQVMEQIITDLKNRLEKAGK